jgi:bacterial/archaeal transporter family protein
MPAWVFWSSIVIVLWGVVGLFQKLGSNRISSQSLLIWLTAGYLLLMPWLLWTTRLDGLSRRDVLIGVLGGLTNGLGAWFLFRSLEAGAKASVAVPLTALNPLVTIALAVTLLAERLSPVQWAGVLLAIVAGMMISYETAEAPKS